MRETQIPYQKSLLKGLQDFTTGSLNNPQLLECFNLMPVEGGLLGHETIRGVGFATLSFDYIRIADQASVVWYWYPMVFGHILFGTTPPTEFLPQIEVIDITPGSGVPSWLEVKDEFHNPWYLYPSSSDGSVWATDTKPSVGVGIQEITWRGSSFERWHYRFNSIPQTYYGVKIG